MSNCEDGNNELSKFEIPGGKNLRSSFPGYYPPDDQFKENLYRRGLVSLDANALLSLYRFSSKARGELLGVLAAVRAQIFITHQAAYEFHRNRLNVVDDRIAAAPRQADELSKILAQAKERIRSFSKRYQSGDEQRDSLCSAVDELDLALRNALTAVDQYDLVREQVKQAVDPVIQKLDELLAGRVGEELKPAEHAAALKEAARRVAEKIPPGFSDKSKGDSLRQAGDYLVWRQLLNQAKISDQPVLLVSDELKEDWVRIGGQNETLGPRPELVLEMQREAGVQFHLSTVLGFLQDARRYLGSQVSSSTLQEAENLPFQPSINSIFSNHFLSRMNRLSTDESRDFYQAVDKLSDWINNGHLVGDHPLVHRANKENDRYVFQWSKRGRASFIIPARPDEKERIELVWISIMLK